VATFFIPTREEVRIIAERSEPLTISIRDHADNEVFCQQLTTLQAPKLRIIQPISVTTSKVDANNFISQFASANVNASGDTPEEALENLRDMIAVTYANLSRFSDRLGPMPRKQLAVLKRYVRERT